jgi:hypothetical protein
MKAIAALNDQIRKVQEEMILLRDEGKKMVHEHQLKQKELQKKLFEAKRAFARFQRKSSIRLHEYVQAVERVRSPSKIPKHVISLEGQLCQSLHQMYIAEKQLYITKEASDDISTNYQIGHDEVLRGKQTGEHILMKKIVELDDENEKDKKEYTQMTQTQHECIVLVKRELHEKDPVAFPIEAINEDVKEEQEDSPKRSRHPFRSFFQTTAMHLQFARSAA